MRQNKGDEFNSCEKTIILPMASDQRKQDGKRRNAFTIQPKFLSDECNISLTYATMRVNLNQQNSQKSGIISHQQPHSDNLASVNIETFPNSKKGLTSNRDKLADIWITDPKRAKRVLDNRQSAARSKERRTRYIQDLEFKLRSLQTQATTLTAQLSLFKKETMGLTTENTELKLRLQDMEQEAQLRDAINEAPGKEVERLKNAVAETAVPAQTSTASLPNGNCN